MAEKGSFEQALDRQGGQSMGAMEAVGRGVAIAAATYGKALLDAAYSPGMQHFVAHGAHELAAALNNGNAFVMYPRGGKDDAHGVHGPEQVAQGGFTAALDRASQGGVHGEREKGMER